MCAIFRRVVPTVLRRVEVRHFVTQRARENQLGKQVTRQTNMPAITSSLASRRSPALAGATRRVHRSVRRAPAPAHARRCVVETRAKLGESLSSYLSYQSARGEIDGDLAIALNSVAIACKRVRALVASAPLAGNTGSAGGAANASGDEQKKLDVMANDVFVDTLRACGRASVIVTEEEEVPVAVERAVGDYIVTFDPIDGSSNIDACVPTGSIFGIYAPGECEILDGDNPEQIMEKCLTNSKQSGQQLVAAGYCMFSSACVFVLSTGDGVHQFEYDVDSVNSGPDPQEPTSGGLGGDATQGAGGVRGAGTPPRLRRKDY